MADQTPENPYSAPASNMEAPSLQGVGAPASQGQRFINFIIDQIILRVIVGAAGFALGVALATARLVDVEDQILLNVIGFIFGLAVTLGYFVIFEGLFQITPGKLVTGTRVVDQAGENASFMQVLGRSCARFIPFEPFSFLFGDKTSGWHDSLSGTRVIRTR